MADPETAPLVRDADTGAIIYPEGCSPMLIKGNNYVISARYDVGTRRENIRGSRFSVFARCTPAPVIGRLDIGTAMARWEVEQFSEGHVGARIRFPGCMLVMSPNFDFTVNGVRDTGVAGMYMWLIAVYLQTETGINVRPCNVRIPNIAVSSDLFHCVDISALLAAESNLWQPPGEFSGITRRLPPPDNRTIILYRTGFMMLTGPNIDRNIELADLVRQWMEKYYTVRNMTAGTAKMKADAHRARTAPRPATAPRAGSTEYAREEPVVRVDTKIAARAAWAERAERTERTERAERAEGAARATEVALVSDRIQKSLILKEGELTDTIKKHEDRFVNILNNFDQQWRNARDTMLLINAIYLRQVEKYIPDDMKPISEGGHIEKQNRLFLNRIIVLNKKAIVAYIIMSARDITVKKHILAFRAAISDLKVFTSSGGKMTSVASTTKDTTKRSFGCLLDLDSKEVYSRAAVFTDYIAIANAERELKALYTLSEADLAKLIATGDKMRYL